MNPLLTDARLLNAWHDHAHAEARRLRQAATGALWRTAEVFLATAATASRRRATRLMQHLGRSRGARPAMPPVAV